MAMAGIIGIDLIIIIMYLAIAVALAEVAITLAVAAVVVKILTVRHPILNLFQVQIDLPIRQLLKSRGNEIF